MRFTGTRQHLLLAALALSSSPSYADEVSDTLDQRLRVIERKLEIQAEEAENKAKGASSANAGEKGFSLKSADGNYELKLRALAQVDARFFLDDSAPRFNDTFILRRLRPSFEGSLGKLVGFRLTPEFAGNNATIVDAYVDLRFHPAATLRAGKLKGPIALERLQSGGAIGFVERGFPTELAPNRDIGVQLQGEIGGGVFSYVTGVYNGTADGRDTATSDVDSRKEVALRLFSEPFRNNPGFFQNLGFGVAGSSGSQFGSAAGTGGVLPQYRTPGQNTFFQYAAGTSANGRHTRFSPQLYFYRNSFGLLSEYISSEQALKLATVEDDVENRAWQVVTSYVLTGEDAGYKGVKPAQPFTLGGDGWGAVEVALRYGQLEIGDAAFDRGFAVRATQAREARDLGIGVNWHLTQNAKLALNYDQTAFKGGAAAGSDREDEKALFTRLQLSY